MASIKRIGIITSGGDCGGLNAVIKGVAKEASAKGIDPVVIPNGYAGLYNLVDFSEVVRLDAERVRRIDATLAGSEAGHSRVKISKISDPDKYERIKQGLRKFGIDALIISGGDDTGSVVVDLGSQGIPCVHVPKTMDLDLQPYSVGGDSAINRIAQAAYFNRVLRSDVKAGTYVIVVAEGLKNASGEMLYDESAGVDAFGHKKLAGAGKYVRQQLEKRFKADPDLKDFMKKAGMYVPGVYEIPEVREVTPGHLVRSGGSSAYDVNFGYRAGAAAVLLLLEGETGNTVVNVSGRKVLYIPTPEAIKRREVDLSEVTLFESLGTCFGRKPDTFSCEFIKVEGTIERPL
jgi:6-phosphofructokinase 1